MHIVIDLFGDEDVISFSPEEFKKEELMRQRVIKEIFRRAPQPQLEIVPISPSRH